MCDGETIEPEHLPDELRGQSVGAAPDRSVPEVSLIERLPQLLAEHNGSRRSLAKALGISERTLYRRLSELDRLDGAPDALSADSQIPASG